MLALTRALLQLRRAEAALAVGDYRPVACAGTLLAYERRFGDTRLLVALNLGPDPLPLPREAMDGERLLSTLSGESNALRGNEGLILKLPA
jgi:alpha-glucosidase